MKLCYIMMLLLSTTIIHSQYDNSITNKRICISNSDPYYFDISTNKVVYSLYNDSESNIYLWDEGYVTNITEGQLIGRSRLQPTLTSNKIFFRSGPRYSKPFDPLNEYNKIDLIEYDLKNQTFINRTRMYSYEEIGLSNSNNDWLISDNDDIGWIGGSDVMLFQNDSLVNITASFNYDFEYHSLYGCRDLVIKNKKCFWKKMFTTEPNAKSVHYSTYWYDGESIEKLNVFGIVDGNPIFYDKEGIATIINNEKIVVHPGIRAELKVKNMKNRLVISYLDSSGLFNIYEYKDKKFNKIIANKHKIYDFTVSENSIIWSAKKKPHDELGDEEFCLYYFNGIHVYKLEGTEQKKGHYGIKSSDDFCIWSNRKKLYVYDLN